MQTSLTALTAPEKLRLLRFMCAFAWADLEISDRERKFVHEVMLRMGLSAEDRALAATWLDHPPGEDELDPSEIPAEHRRFFLEAALEMVASDGVIDPMEAENFAVFEALMDLGDRWDEED